MVEKSPKLAFKLCTDPPNGTHLTAPSRSNGEATIYGLNYSSIFPVRCCSNTPTTTTFCAPSRYDGFMLQSITPLDL